MPPQNDSASTEGQQPIANAAPEQVDAHRNMLSEIFKVLESQGVNTAQVTNQAGAAETNPQQMSHSDLLATTLALARQHPEIVAMVAQRFPKAQGLLNSVLGANNATQGSAGSLLGGLLGNL